MRSLEAFLIDSELRCTESIEIKPERRPRIKHKTKYATSPASKNKKECAFLRKTIRINSSNNTTAALERKGQSLDYPYPFTVEEDIRELQKKYSEMNKLLIGFDGADQNTYRELLTKYAYALGRVNRLLPVTADEKSQKSKLLVEILNFKSDLDRKVKSHQRACLNKSQGVLDISLLKHGSSSSDSDSLPDDDVLSPPKFESTRIQKTFKSIPVSKWNIKFSGKPTDISTNAFLERLEELKTARYVSDAELFKGCI
ncbi:hypothetical protein RN001_006704 [Aquatica leii]|uniref:Uncharacterized protein n=1 Tax=Aquatica leii TaxID=1421715 RepID=A0AAN7Q913_9COLE|nr:hypothetical protein RN001_006704 [Aquatica leii]